MALVFIDDLATGMTLAEDLFTPTGRFVLAEGAALNLEHLQKFKSWGIIEVAIADESLGEEYLKKQEQLAQYTELADIYLRPRFSLNDLEVEPMVTIYRHALQQAAQLLQSGWDPEKFKVAELPSPAGASQPLLSVPQMLRGDVELVSLPSVYSHIVNLLNDPDTSTHRLAAVISKDATLTVRLLKLVNSPFYGFSGKIDSISRAVSLLGTNELTGLALGVTVIRQFKEIPSDLLNMELFWRHSIRCGLYARILAKQLGVKGEEKYFIGGLLHDIGRLIMLERMPSLYLNAVGHARREAVPVYRAELEKLQSDHSIVGKLLAMRWRLPTPLIRMIGGHHSPSAHHYSQEASLMHIADIMAHACGEEVMLVNEVPPLQAKAWDAGGLKEDMLAPAVHQVESDFADIVSIFFGGQDE